MDERQDFIALEWVAGEIGETLTQAGQALEAYIANRDDATKLRFCLTHIHQVHGTLQMVEFFGAALLAKEMEDLAHSLARGNVHESHVEDALSVLKNAINQLPVYLEKVKASRHGLPATLLPVLNDLRAVRGENMLSETVLFAPDMDRPILLEESGDGQVSGSELIVVAQKLRQMFQVALLGFIRGNDVRKNLNYLAKVCARLVKVSAGQPFQQLWRVCIAVLEGLLNGSIDDSIAVKILLRQVDRQIKEIITSGGSSLEQSPPEDLLKNLLYYVARSKASSKFISEIKTSYKLDAALLGDGELTEETLATPDDSTMQAVIEALARELGDIKFALENSANDTAALTETLALFRRVSDTMAILGLGANLKQLQQPYSQLAKMLATQDSLSSNELAEIIDQIATAERELLPAMQAVDNPAEPELFNDSEEAQQHLDQAFDSVLRESRRGLEQAKDAIVEFVATQWNHECLTEVPTGLAAVSGSLAMIPLVRAARIVRCCEQYVSRELLENKAVPDWQKLDTLADAITSVDYYLERLVDDSATQSEAILDLAAESVQELGYPVASPGLESVAQTSAGHVVEEEQLATLLDQPQDQLQLDSIPVLAEVIPFQPSVVTGQQQEEVAADTDTQPGPEPAPAAEPDLNVAAMDDSSSEQYDEDFDPEIAEIFVEEAGEVIETIAEYLPQWRLNISDDESRSTVRRGFHTLKGSGRMVGAKVIGELAWAVENMLNRVIDGSVTMDPARFDLLEEVNAYVPSLVEAFEQRAAVDTTNADALAGRANILAIEQNPQTEQQQAVTEQELPQVTQAGDAAVELPVLDNVVADVSDDEQQPNEIPASVEEPVADDIDSELLEIFAAEASTHTRVLEAFVVHSQHLAGPAELTDELQRALHTLKGSANMAGVEPVAKVVTPVELLVKELRASQLKADLAVVDILERGAQFIKSGIEQLATTPMAALAGVDDYIEELTTLLHQRLAQITPDADDGGIPVEALNQFLTDSLDRIMDISEQLALWQQGQLDATGQVDLNSTLEQFIEHADSVNMLALSELAHAMQALYRRAGARAVERTENSFFALAARGNDTLIDLLDQVAGHQTPSFDQQLLNAIQDYEFAIAPEKELADPVAGLDETLAMEVVELNDDELVDAVLDQDTDPDPDGSELDENLVNLLFEDQALQSDADVVEMDYDQIFSGLDSNIPLQESGTVVDGSITEAMEPPLEKAEEAKQAVAVESQPISFTSNVDVVDNDDDIDDEIIGIFFEEADELLEASDEAIHSWAGDRSNAAYLDDLLRILHTFKGGARLAGLTQLGDLSHNFESSLIGLQGGDVSIDDLTLNGIQDYQDQLLSLVAVTRSGDIDADIELIDEIPDVAVSGAVEPDHIAVDEAEEIAAFEVEPQQELVEQALESEDIDPETSSAVQAQEQSADIIELAEDDLLDIESLDLESCQVEPEPEPEPETDAETVDEPLVATEPPVDKPVEVEAFIRQRPRAVSAKEIANSLVEPAARKGPQEVVKVSAQLLEELVNLAGETSISRGRAEEQISELVFSLDDMQITVDRLQEQVRRLDMETQQQILYRQEQVESEGMEGFDPLEMDRYSQLQQLSRSLLESSSDLVDIKSTLSDKSRDMETLLVQQSRINTDLQEGLMRSRMVPFSGMVPRLRRIIRQVSGELNKKVDLHLENVEGELDRSVLERMVAPLEHMLRNAVDHGIESAQQREASGKPARGSVTLGIAREGSEIVIRLLDDGAGIDLDAVKNKAIERGLMEPGADLSDREILQFIIQAGFSTASEVTQISGRGVGLDVVHSEIKQLGGSMEIDSVAGKGTRFTVRLPFTVSVNRALMVNIGGDIYAIPLNTIEGIVRVSPFELEAYYQPEAPMFEYAGQPYLLRYMGALLQRGEKPNLEGQSMPLPVVLVRGTDHSVAVQVDSLMGSREIVVKPLGPQFSMVQGLSGATVLGDGSVVVILDLLAMIRADASNMYREISRDKAALADQEHNITVMVVDDSVTVRKVTSRFLERHGMDVVLAKDGVDAVTQLQDIERLPDVMLLDIEMPRMDGFGVASRVRHNSRLQDIPIIMITSRTGEKHRERALSLGVNEYIGKPYQESELLETINELTGAGIEQQ